MTKTDILRLITEQLAHDLAVQYNGALAAHEASTHEENIPDNKYETLALEASYLAQGQANRAREIRLALEAYRQLRLQDFDDDSAIALTALVTLEADDGDRRRVFIGPLEGGMKIAEPGSAVEIVVITPASPLGRELIGETVGSRIRMISAGAVKEFEIAAVS